MIVGTVVMLVIPELDSAPGSLEATAVCVEVETGCSAMEVESETAVAADSPVVHEPSGPASRAETSSVASPGSSVDVSPASSDGD